MIWALRFFLHQRECNRIVLMHSIFSVVFSLEPPSYDMVYYVYVAFHDVLEKKQTGKR